ncbi:MAG: twin-arginine translocase subunit TatC [Phycisphaerales bacterium]|nr:twin-arginine translocase subunit TatC [Phycisphaerales bacterium]
MEEARSVVRRIVRPGEDTPDAKTMSFLDHLDELRSRLMWAMIGLLPILIAALYFGPQMLELIVHPVLVKLREAGQPPEMQSTSPFETFFTYIKLSLIVTLIVGGPWVLWNLWKFVSPGLYINERKIVRLMIPLSGLLSVLGVAFLWAVALPTTLFFMINFSTDIGRDYVKPSPIPPGVVLAQIPVLTADPPEPKIGEAWINSTFNEYRVCLREADQGVAPLLWSISGATVKPGVGSATLKQQYKVDDYTDTFLSLALGFAIAFQTPVVVLILGWLGIVDQAFLRKYRRHAIMASAVVGALATPGDPSMMLLLGIPMWLLYELGVLLLRLIPPRRGEVEDVPIDPDEGESSGPGASTPNPPPPSPPTDNSSDERFQNASWRPKSYFDPTGEKYSPDEKPGEPATQSESPPADGGANSTDAPSAPSVEPPASDTPPAKIDPYSNPHGGDNAGRPT